MTTVTTAAVVDDDGLAAYLALRSDIVIERDDRRVRGDGDPPTERSSRARGETTHFELDAGPFRRYARSVVVEPVDAVDGRAHHRVTQTVEFTLGIGVWSVLFRPIMGRVFRRPGGRTPWWAPPQVLDTQGAAALASLAYLSIVAGYLGTLITQTLTYAAEEFEVGDRGQGDALAGIRIGVLLSLAIAAWADRHGRRRALLWCAAGGCIMAAFGAVSPGLLFLSGTQVVARGLSTALALLIVIVVAEEMPAGSRAYGVSLLTMTGALGAGMVLWFLPIIDIDESYWRLLYVFPLVFLPLVRGTAKLLPESRRFVRRHAAARFAGHGRRLALLAGTTFALAIFSSPASQLQNEFLRERYDFSATNITLFTVLTVTPASLGIVIGGRLADTRGKRLIGGIGLFGGAVFTVGQYLSGSLPLLWVASAAGSIIGGLAVPALAVYGPELFPTALRTKANVVMSILGVTGSVVGLAIAGRLADRWSLGPAISVLAIAPILAVVFLIPFYPETSNRELEELNPEDALESP